MVDYDTASRTKDYHQLALLNAHPEIVSLCPEPVRDEAGHRTGDAVIRIGVLAEAVRAIGLDQLRALLPARLQAVGEDGHPLPGVTVDVVVVVMGPIVAEAYTTQERPCPGGYSVSHVAIPGGTLGGVARLGAAWGFVLSNNHILAAMNLASPGDHVVQPGALFSVDGRDDRVASLEKFVAIDFAGGLNEVDCALAEARSPWDSYVSREVFGIGTPQATADAVLDQQIRKVGSQSEKTEGMIHCTNATIVVRYPTSSGYRFARFTNQLEYTRITQRGDSGSLIWDRHSLTVLGLHFAGGSRSDQRLLGRGGAAGAVGSTPPEGYSYGNKIGRVLELLGASLV